MTADALERLRELASTAALQQHRYYTDGVETLEHADHTNPFDTCQSADCALVRAGGVETPAQEPSEVVCECGHLASEHGSPKPTRCIVRGCGCKKNRAMVEATDVPQQSEDADIVRDITAIVREADETFQRVGGGTRHWVRDCFLPFLNQKGWIVTGAAIVRSARPSPPPATPQEPEQ